MAEKVTNMQLVAVTIVVCLGCFPIAQSQETPGRVYLGQESDNGTIEVLQLYSFNENFQPGALEIPVYLTLINETIGDPIEYLLDVVVTCQLLPSDDSGFSQGTFLEQTVLASSSPSDPEFLQIPFENLIAGRPVEVQCWGESVIVGEESAQFTKADSMSDNYAFEIRPAGVANIYNRFLLLPNRPVDSYPAKAFLIELSEETITNVTIRCALNDTGVVDPMGLEFYPQPRSFEPGVQRLMMGYNVTAKGNPTPFYCTAESDNAGDFVQFQLATSIGDTAVVLLAESTATLFPEAAPIRTTTLTAMLVLNEIPVTETIFDCTIQVVNTTDQANDIAADETCIGPDLPEIPNPPTLPPFVTADENATTNAPVTTVAPPTTTPAPTTPPPTTPTGGPGETTGTPPPSTPPPALNVTGQWQLDNSEIIFDPDQALFATLTLTRNPDEVLEPTQEIVVTRCCAPETLNVNSPQFVNVSTTMMTVAFLEPFQAINWTAGTPVGSETVQTPILNPAFVNIAPCPCDVRADACDVDCCCDESCTTDELTTFTCIPGVEGGFPPPPQTFNCDQRSPLSEDWFPFLCVQTDNTGFLGYYLFDKPLLRDQAELNAALEEFGSPLSFRFNTSAVPSGSGSEYREGDSVKTGFQRDTVEVGFDIGVHYRLALPARTWTGKCVWSNPVQFLVDDHQECVHQMKESLCIKESSLNALNYAQNSLWTGQTGAEVLRQVGSQIIAETNVNYLCADDNEEYTDKYFKSTDTLSDVMPRDQVFTFDYTLPVGEDNETLCNFDADTGAFVCVNQSDVQPAPQPVPPRCGFDDGFTRPPTPVYDEITNTCHNSVVGVQYNFVWSGQDILYLNATVVLADIPLEMEKMVNVSIRYTATEEINNQTVRVSRVNFTEEIQTFTTEFTQIFNTNFESYPVIVEFNETNIENITDSTIETYQRSGNPGYDIGLPVISAVGDFDETTGALSYFNANDSQRISLWEPSSAGLCTNAGRQVATFGENSITNCVLRLSAAELDDCDNLRKLILNRQDAMMPSSFVSIGGDPSRFNKNDWTQVFRQDITSIINITEEVAPTTESSFNATTEEMVTGTEEVPTTTVTEQLLTTENPFLQSFLDELEFPYAASITGRCLNIPSGITANIMYAEVGRSGAQAIYQIVGANIEYTLATWRMFCAGKQGGVCYGNESYVEQDGTVKIQPFVLTTSVNYIKVPAQAAPPKTEYEERNQVPSYICQQDACWRELFYPWTQYNLSNEETYALVMGLLFVVYGIGLVFIVRPISRW